MSSLLSNYKSICVVAVLFALSPAAHADSTASAIASLGWSAATFSGTTSPASIPNPYSSLAEASAAGSNPYSFNGGTVTSPGWTTTTDLLPNGSNSFVLAQSGSAITSLASAATSDGFFQLNGQAERSGDLTTKTGLIQITVPYTLAILMTPDTNGVGRSGTAQVWIELFDALGQNMLGFANSSVELPQSLSGVTGKSGTLTLTLQEAPGTYWFDLGAASEVTVVPEPGTLLLVIAGLAAVGLKFRGKI
ncbi:MAG: PEP-CTERM sorting domain-containing protein [Acidobacteria bacterium]|nr:PEP-CTERM sorting domain-containing protein [Acidobacteriota bacterium]MBS1866533.1 PEP-CTERM sorting domain-containing protein [Acidobacteriota bacterium]